MGLFGFFRHPAQPHPVSKSDSMDGTLAANSKVCPPLPPPVSLSASLKRRTTPPTSGRTAEVVAERWKASPADIKVEEEDGAVAISYVPMATLAGADTDTSSKSNYADMEPTIVVTGPVAQLYGGCAAVDGGGMKDQEDDHSGSDSDSNLSSDANIDSEYEDDSNFIIDRPVAVRPSSAAAFKPRTMDILESIETDAEGEGNSDSNKNAGHAKSRGAVRAMGRRRHGPDRFVPGSSDSDDDDDDDDYSSDEEHDEDVEELQNWEWLFEPEPPVSQADEEDKKLAVDPAELQAYAEGVASIAGYQDRWTMDERRLHRLLSLRGFHPLLPAAWSRDFLGVPMYPSLFAPDETEPKAKGDAPDETRQPAATVIRNYGSQFHATRALRALFDLQARVSSLRQAGDATHRIGAIVERELRRYIAWAATDSGLDRCEPFATMPNIAAKEFQPPPRADSNGDGSVDVESASAKQQRLRRKKGGRRVVKSLARQIQDYFDNWVREYRAYYAKLPAYPVVGEEVGAGDDDDDDNGSTKKRPKTKGKGKKNAVRGRRAPQTRPLQPPRLLYGFVIVQHAVLLLVVDAGATGGKTPTPRCFANFNLSLGDHWLDASLNVAIPVHLARAAQLRCAQGLALPTRKMDDADEDV